MHGDNKNLKKYRYILINHFVMIDTIFLII